MGSFLASATWPRLAWTAGATSLAISSKYTGVLLLPCFLLGLAVRAVGDLRGDRDGIGRSALRSGGLGLARGAIFLVLVGLFTWALHGFGVAGSQPSVVLGPLPTVSIKEPGFLAAFRVQMIHNQFGHPSFLCGSRSMSGWWYYHPVAILLKSTLPELVVFSGVFIIVSIQAAGRAARLLRLTGTTRPAGPKVDPCRLMMLVYFAILSIALVRSHIN
jgi:hypothetical protein